MKHVLQRLGNFLNSLTLHLWLPALPAAKSPGEIRLFLNGKVLTVRRK